MPGQRIPNKHLRGLLEESGLTAHALARAVNSLGAQHGLRLTYDRTSVAHWLTGARPPAPVPELVSQVLSRRLRHPVSRHDTGLAPAVGRKATALPEPDGPPGSSAVRLRELCRVDLDPLQRSELTRMPYLPPAPLPGAGAVPGSPRSHSLDPEVPGARSLEDMAAAVGAHPPPHGGAHVKTALVTYLADGAIPLLVGASDEHCRRRLRAGVARLTLLLADCSLDSGAHGLAQRYHRFALALANEAEEPFLQAAVHHSMSAHALLLGHCLSAAELAEHPLRAAKPGGPPFLRALLLTRRAHALAHSDRRRALADLQTVEQCLTSPSHGSWSDAPTYCGRVIVESAYAEALIAVGAHPAALAVLRKSLRGHPSDHARARALHHALMAQVLLETGRIEAACRHSHSFIDLARHLDSHHVRVALEDLRTRLHSFHRASPSVATVARRIRSADRQPAAAG